MLVIRLFRRGKRNQPFYKIVVTDKKRSSKGGRFVEELGFLNPLTKEKKINGERAKYWVSVGAKPSPTIYNLLVNEKVLTGEKIPVHKAKKGGQEAAAPVAPKAGPVVTPEAGTAPIAPENKPEEKKEEVKSEEIKAEPKA